MITCTLKFPKKENVENWFFCVKPFLLLNLACKKNIERELKDSNGKTLKDESGKKKKEIIGFKEWSELTFSFSSYSRIYDTPKAYQLEWGDSLKEIKYSIVIKSADEKNINFEMYRGTNELMLKDTYSIYDFIRLLKDGMIINKLTK